MILSDENLKVNRPGYEYPTWEAFAIFSMYEPLKQDIFRKKSGNNANEIFSRLNVKLAIPTLEKYDACHGYMT